MINLNTLITKRSSITLIPLLLASGSMVRGYETLLELQDALGTLYYDGTWQETGDRCAELMKRPGWSDTQIGIPGCVQEGTKQADLKTNRIVALNQTLMQGDMSAWCGKEVKIFNGEEEVIFDEPLVLWDKCQACSEGVRVDFGLDPYLKLNPAGCSEQGNNIPGLTVRVVDNQIWQPALASTSHSPIPATTLYTGGVFNVPPNSTQCTINPYGAVISGNAAANSSYPEPTWIQPQGGTPVACGNTAGVGASASATAVTTTTANAGGNNAPSSAPTLGQSIPSNTASFSASQTGVPTSVPGVAQGQSSVPAASSLSSVGGPVTSSAPSIPPGGAASNNTGSSTGIPTSIPQARPSVGVAGAGPGAYSAGASLPGVNAFASASAPPASGGGSFAPAVAGSASSPGAAAESGQVGQEIPGSEEADCEKGTYSCDGLNLRICGDIQSGTTRIGWIPTGQCPTQCEADCGVILCN